MKRLEVSGECRAGFASPFWIAVFVLQAGVFVVATRSVGVAVAMAAAIGVAALLVPWIGTPRGTLVFGVVLLVTALVLPGDMALKYRIPVGGGGIFIVDVLLMLLVLSWSVQLLLTRSIEIVHSPLTVPVILFLVWVMIAAVIGQLRGNDIKVILQDARGLAYYVLFLWIITLVRSKDVIKLVLRVLGVCLVTDFVIGALLALQGQGERINFVEEGVSRFPAPNEVFVMGTAMLATMVVVWPSGRRRPWYLWLLLVASLVGVLLALVRGYWIGLGAGMAFLFVITRAGQRVRLVVGGLGLLLTVVVALAAFSPALFESLVTRALAIGAYASDTSIQYRLIENRAVEQQIGRHPVFGNGLGTGYLFDFSRYGVKPFVKVYIHNNYLWFVQRMGVLGLGLFAWMMAAFLFSWRDLRPSFTSGDPWLVGLIMGSRVMVVSLLVVSISSPQFNVKGQVAVTAVIMGLAEVAGVLLREESDGAGVPAGNPGPVV